ncbi:MAG: LCP family protein [Clostridiales Family XIII bacterium]|jgi:LCP family protein required for cell wall assembly|nr:LCP family protein [Clostridiales Family XIII bacterium]
MSNRKTKKPKKPMTPKRLFRKVFFITLPICLLVFTGSIFGAMKLLDAKPMNHSGVVAPKQTEEKLDLLIPGEGIFKSKYYDSKRVNVLAYGNTDEGLADTIMLFSFDPEAQSVDVISIPRDTYYERKGFAYGGYLKINAAALEGPLELCKAVHNVLLGIPINYYAMVDYKGVEKIVDSMDGVEMDVPMNMHYTSKKQNLYIDIKKGKQVLDGAHAVQFLRFRKGYADGDLGRVKAQQEFIKNAAKQALSGDLLKIGSTVVENVDSTITPRALLYLADEAKGMTEGGVKAYTLPGKSSTINKLSFFVRAEDSEIDTMLRQIYDGPAAATETPDTASPDSQSTDTPAGSTS